MFKNQMVIISTLMLFLFNGCTTMKKFNINCQRDIENTILVYEKIIKSPYREVFLASLSIVHDWGAEIFLKDYDKGVILVRTYMNWSVPGDMFGLYFSNNDSEGTKVTLRVTRRTYGLDSARPEDVFSAIEKEIQFKSKIAE